jgi:hypothetical protein
VNDIWHRPTIVKVTSPLSATDSVRNTSCVCVYRSCFGTAAPVLNHPLEAALLEYAARCMHDQPAPADDVSPHVGTSLNHVGVVVVIFVVADGVWWQPAAARRSAAAAGRSLGADMLVEVAGGGRKRSATKRAGEVLCEGEFGVALYSGQRTLRFLSVQESYVKTQV